MHSQKPAPKCCLLSRHWWLLRRARGWQLLAPPKCTSLTLPVSSIMPSFRCPRSVLFTGTDFAIALSNTSYTIFSEYMSMAAGELPKLTCSHVDPLLPVSSRTFHLI